MDPRILARGMLGAIALHELGSIWERSERRRELMRQAEVRAQALDRPLVVFRPDRSGPLDRAIESWEQGIFEPVEIVQARAAELSDRRQRLRELEATGARLALLVRSTKVQRGAPSVVVAGFSQGGHLAWYPAARGVVDGAAIASGALPPSFAVSRPSRKVLLRYVSGVEDKTVPWETVRETSRQFKDSGYDVQGRQLKAGHSLADMGYSLSQLLDEVVVRLIELGH